MSLRLHAFGDWKEIRQGFARAGLPIGEDSTVVAFNCSVDHGINFALLVDILLSAFLRKKVVKMK